MTGTHTVHPTGDLDLATADAVVAPWLDLIRRAGPTTLIVDLTHVTFVDSAGLSALIRLRKQLTLRGGQVQLRNASWQIRKLLSITALDQAFPGAHLPADPSTESPGEARSASWLPRDDRQGTVTAAAYPDESGAG